MAMLLKRWRDADFIMLLFILALLAYGLAMVYSATFPSTDSDSIVFSTFVQKQIVFAVAGLALMAVVASVDYRIYHAGAYFAYVVSLVLLALLFVLGHGGDEWGSQRWIDMGFFPLQPSEVAKPALVLALARYFSDHHQDIRAFKHFVVSALIMLPPLALVYMQPDLGTATSFLAIWLIMSLGAGIRIRFLAATVAAGLASLPVIWSLLKEYMRDRITIFLHPESDPWGQGYNIIQAQISIGSGGMFGQGFLAGTQSQGHFLRIQHSDFIFSVLAEEMGFRGAFVLFALFFLLLMRLISAASAARDPFGRMVAVGVAATLLFSISVNVAANLRLMPVTGIPLPFISYGGSALLTNLASLGLVQSVLMRRKKFPSR